MRFNVRDNVLFTSVLTASSYAAASTNNSASVNMAQYSSVTFRCNYGAVPAANTVQFIAQGSNDQVTWNNVTNPSGATVQTTVAASSAAGGVQLDIPALDGYGAYQYYRAQAVQTGASALTYAIEAAQGGGKNRPAGVALA